MSQCLKWLYKISAMLCATFAFTMAYAQQGVTPINPPQPVENDGKVEVLEFFAYGCIHCAQLESAFEAWVKKLPADVKVKRVPSPAALMGIDSTVLYYSLEALGQVDRLHAKIFEAAHLQKVVLGNPAVLNQWLEKNGVNPKQYEDVQKSFSVVTKVARARQMIQDYKIRSTPLVAVNGRFLVAEQTAGGAPLLFATVDQLIAQSRTAMKSRATAANVAPAKAPK